MLPDAAILKLHGALMSGQPTEISRLLADAGLVPNTEAAALNDRSMEPGSDLLPRLAEVWATAGRQQSKQSTRVTRWLDDARKRCARLTWGLPAGFAEPASRWIGFRIFWWPDGIPAGRRMAFISSRIGRAWDERSAWFTVLRAASANVNRTTDLLVTSPSTTTDRYVQRCAELFGLRTLNVHVPRDGWSLGKWFGDLVGHTEDESLPGVCRLSLSPQIDCVAVGSTPGDVLTEIPLRDRTVAALGDRIVALHIRRGGHLHALLSARLRESSWPTAGVTVALGAQHVSNELAEELLSAGAVGWLVMPSEDAQRKPAANELAESNAAASPGRAPIISMPTSQPWTFLTHTTRRRTGPWPDETEAEFLDQLILALDSTHRSALASLIRIVSQQRIVASGEGIRGGTLVVSFTEVPLAELNRLRTFRPHRGRWDFEPYGLCVRKDWLESHGARAVVYGEEPQWESLTPALRPYFQRKSTRARGQSEVIDWTVEREWRLVGNADLSLLGPDEAFVFVPTHEEADQIAAVSRWPVAVVPS